MNKPNGCFFIIIVVSHHLVKVVGSCILFHVLEVVSSQLTGFGWSGETSGTSHDLPSASFC